MADRQELPTLVESDLREALHLGRPAKEELRRTEQRQAQEIQRL